MYLLVVKPGLGGYGWAENLVPRAPDGKSIGRLLPLSLRGELQRTDTGRGVPREDDLAHRLQGRSRYALPLANRVLVRYAAETLIAVGAREVAVAVSSATAADVADLIGDGSRFGATFRYLEVGEHATALQMLSSARQELGEAALIVHAGDALVTGGLRDVVADFERSHPDVLLVSERSHSYPEAVRSGVRGADHSREQQLGGLDHVAPAAIVSSAALQELEGFRADTSTLGGTMAALAEAGREG